MPGIIRGAIKLLSAAVRQRDIPRSSPYIERPARNVAAVALIAAMVRLVKNASVHAGSLSNDSNQRSENPRGGKANVLAEEKDIGTTIRTGTSRNVNVAHAYITRKTREKDDFFVMG